MVAPGGVARARPMDCQQDQDPISRAFHESGRVGEQAIDRLREARAAAPEDLERRARLLGALAFRVHPEPSKELVEEVVWWIRQHPRDLRSVSGALHQLARAPYWAYQPI